MRKFLARNDRFSADRIRDAANRPAYVFQVRDSLLLAYLPDHLIAEQALDGKFSYEEGGDPCIRAGTVAVYAGGHELDDDDLAGPDGSEVASTPL